MIDLYYFPSPNTWKVSIMLEECGIHYRVCIVDITQDEQQAADYLAISPNGRVPAIVDRDAPEGPRSVFESGAILVVGNDIDESYREFARSLIMAIARLGVSLSAAHVPHAYCDGRFDLAWRGLKVGGMAQRRRVRDGLTSVWIHAVLSIEAEALRYPKEVERYYMDLGSPRIADPRTSTTLSRCMTVGSPVRNLLQRCGDSIADMFESRAVSERHRPAVPASADTSHS